MKLSSLMIPCTRMQIDILLTDEVRRRRRRHSLSCAHDSSSSDRAFCVFFVHYLTPFVSHTPCLHAYTPPSSSHIFVQSFSFVPHASCTHPSFRAAFWLMHPFFLLLQQIVFSLRPHASLSRVQTPLWWSIPFCLLLRNFC